MPAWDDTGMSGKNFTENEISIGLDRLIEKVSRVSVFVEMFDRYFDDFVISRRTMPLAMAISELIFHLYGQMTRYCFDRSRSHKVASLCTVYEEIEIFSKEKSPKGARHENLFKEAKAGIEEIEINYKKRMKAFIDKHYAHLEVRTLEQAQQDYEALKLGWDDFKALVSSARDLLNKILLYWEDAESDFAENQYEEFQRLFWEIIELPENIS